MTDRVCFSNTCRELATKFIDAGMWWPDGRVLYTHACDAHVQKVIDHQRDTWGITVTVHTADEIELVSGCAAAWRSHGCGLPDDHTGDHVCDPGACDDSPTADDHVFHAWTDADCARSGGVPK